MRSGEVGPQARGTRHPRKLSQRRTLQQEGGVKMAEASPYGDEERPDLENSQSRHRSMRGGALVEARRASLHVDFLGDSHADQKSFGRNAHHRHQGIASAPVVPSTCCGSDLVTMIPRLISRAAQSRAASTRVASLRSARPSSPSLRTYASKKPHHPAQPKPSPFQDDPQLSKAAKDVSYQGPIKNVSFPPLRPASNEASKTPAADGEASHYTSRQPEFDSPSASDKHSPQVPRRDPSSPADPTLEQPRADLSPEQPEFESTASAQGGKDPNVEAAQTAQGANGASDLLPDLRHGIPSTFDKEFMDQLHKTQDARDEKDAAGQEHGPEPPEERSRRTRESRGEEYVSSIERRRNAMFRYLGIVGVTFTLVGAGILGRNWDTLDEARKYHDAPDGWSPSAIYKRLKTRLGDYFGYYTEPAFPTLLPKMGAGMMPPYTLVFSLEDLLVSSKWTPKDGWQVAKRPGVDYFLRYLSQYYELVLFTSVYSMNADMVLRKLDPFSIITFPLFREATRYVKGSVVKDLSYLNRELSKTIIIDTKKEHVQLQPENAILLPKWSGAQADPHTKDLVALIPFLEYVATSGTADIRPILKSYEGSHIPTEYAKREARAREAFDKRLDEEKKKRGKFGSAAGGLSSMLGFKPGNTLMQVPGEPTLAESLAAGKMPSDIVRERGQRQYLLLEKEIRENGETWLKEREAEEKKMMEEATKSMQGSVGGVFSMFGSGDKKQ